MLTDFAALGAELARIPNQRRVGRVTAVGMAALEIAGLSNHGRIGDQVAIGLGVYALQRWPRPVAIECLRLVVERLHERAQRDEHGLYWWTPPEGLLHPESRKQFPSGRADLGVAHGMGGAIGHHHEGRAIGDAG